MWIAVVAIAVGWTLQHGRAPVVGRTSAAFPVTTDTLAAYQALVEGTRLSAAGQNAASLPQLRAAVSGLPGTWEARFNLASSLENAALESSAHLGREDPVIRSSVERIGLVAEACREREVALTLANDPHRRAWTVYVSAKVWLTWGMPLDALALARAAQALDPAWDAPGLLASQIEADLAGGGEGK